MGALKKIFSVKCLLTFFIRGTGVGTYDGIAGNDTLDGGAGADKLYGGAGDDTASYVGATTGVTVNLGGTKYNESGTVDSDAAKNIFIKGVGGDAADDLLNSIEHLTGGAGNDRLTGNDGDNTLTGGGNDVFGVADSATSAALADLITDFTSGDKLDVGSLTHIWFDNSDAVTGVGTSTNYTVIYAGNADNSAADTSKVLAVLQDFTTDLTGTDFNGTITVAEIA